MRTSNLVCCFALSFSFIACAGQEPIDADLIEEGEVDSASLALSTTYASLRTGNWSDSTMWNPGGVPGAQDVVNIGSAHQVTADVAAEASSVKLVDFSNAKVIMNNDLSVSGNILMAQNCIVDLNNNTLHAGSITMQRGATIPRDPGSRLAAYLL